MKQWKTPAGQAQNFAVDALSQAHLLVAGSTGSGKSVLINNLIYTALYKSPNDVALILIDPKRVELVQYKPLPHCIAYASEPDDIIFTLRQSVQLMEQRYKRMQKLGIRQSTEAHIYIIVDEFGDLMTVNRKQAEPLIIRLSQLGRAANIHLILATQNPSRKVITAGIQLNMTASIALHCRDKIESRMITGQIGAENLPLFGYGLYLTPHYTNPQLIRINKINDKALIDRVKWWTDQMHKSFIFRRSR